MRERKTHASTSNFGRDPSGHVRKHANTLSLSKNHERHNGEEKMHHFTGKQLEKFDNPRRTRVISAKLGTFQGY